MLFRSIFLRTCVQPVLGWLTFTVALARRVPVTRIVSFQYVDSYVPVGYVTVLPKINRSPEATLPLREYVWPGAGFSTTFAELTVRTVTLPRNKPPSPELYSKLEDAVVCVIDIPTLMPAVEDKNNVLAFAATAVPEPLIAYVAADVAYVREVPPLLAVSKAGRIVRSAGKCGLSCSESVLDRKSTRLNSSHSQQSRMPSSA